MKVKDSVQGVLGVILLYLIIVVGVILVNARLEQIENTVTGVTVNTNTNQ